MTRPRLVEHWTLLDGDRELVAGKRGASRLAFALMLKFYARHGRFPDDHADLPGDVVEFVARQVQVAPEAVRGYEFSGRTTEYHRAQIRRHFGFRDCTVEDARGFKAGSPSQEILHQPAWTDRLTIEDRRGITPLIWAHVVPHGEIRLDMGRRLELPE